MVFGTIVGSLADKQSVIPSLSAVLGESGILAVATLPLLYVVNEQVFQRIAEVSWMNKMLKGNRAQLQFMVISCKSSLRSLSAEVQGLANIDTRSLCLSTLEDSSGVILVTGIHHTKDSRKTLRFPVGSSAVLFDSTHLLQASRF